MCTKTFHSNVYARLFAKVADSDDKHWKDTCSNCAKAANHLIQTTENWIAKPSSGAQKLEKEAAWYLETIKVKVDHFKVNCKWGIGVTPTGKASKAGLMQACCRMILYMQSN